MGEARNPGDHGSHPLLTPPTLTRKCSGVLWGPPPPAAPRANNHLTCAFVALVQLLDLRLRRPGPGRFCLFLGAVGHALVMHPLLATSGCRRADVDRPGTGEVLHGSSQQD